MVLLYDFGVTVVVSAVVVALVDVLIGPAIKDANSSIVTGRAVGQMP